MWLRSWGGDVSELFFWSGNLAGLGVLVGAAVSYLIDPAINGCGELTPFHILCFVLTSAVGVIFWGPTYVRDGFAFTL